MTEGPAGVPRAPLGYRETMAVPVAIWVVTLATWALFAAAMGLTLGPWVGWPLMLLGGGGLVLGLHAARGRVAVDDGSLTAGRATLPLAHAGATASLDAASARVLRGTGADPRAYLYLRSWVATAVRIEVDDPDDPAPYWYVSTRRPAQLVAAVEAGRP